jgi:hypothetical protein
MSHDHESAAGDRSAPVSAAVRNFADHIGQPFMLAVVAVGAAGYLMRLAHLPYAREVNALGCILMMIAMLVLAIAMALRKFGWLPKGAAPERGATPAPFDARRKEPTEILECVSSPAVAGTQAPPLAFGADGEGGARPAFRGGAFSITVGGRPRIAAWTTDIRN